MTGDLITEEAILAQGNVVYKQPDALSDTLTHYCPGCTHGIIHRLIAEAIDELGIRERTILVAPVGCSVLMYYYYQCGCGGGRAWPRAGHGDRSQTDPAGQGGVHLPGRRRPGVHRRGGDPARGQSWARTSRVFFVNNAVYGMTSGQMAPTTPARAR